jgi:AsmA protein
VRRLAKWVGILVAALILAVLCLPFFINVDQFRPTLQSELTRALGRDVTLGNLHLNVLAGAVTADDLSVSEDPAFGKPAFLRAKSLYVGVKILPFLFSRKLVVTDLDVDQPEIAMVQAASGDWNFSSLGGRSQNTPGGSPAAAKMPLDLSVELVKVSNGRLTLRRTIGHWKPLVLEQANLELRNFSATSAFPFSLSAKVRGGGAIQVDGKAGPINPKDSAMTPVNASLNMAQLDLAGSGANDFAPHVAGLVSLNGSAESDGTNMRVKGKLKAEKLKIARNGTAANRPLEFDFSAQHNIRKHSGALLQGDIHIGNAPAHLTGTYAEQGESVVLNMKLAGPNMPVQELEAILPAMGIVLPAGTSLRGGAASASLSMEGPADRLVTGGSLVVNNTRLAGFDLSRKMSSIEKLAGIKAGPDTEIQTLSATVRAAPEGIDAQDIKLVVPAIGEVSGAGSISPANALDFKMSAMVHTSGLLAPIGNKPIPFTVTGICSEPVIRPDIKAVVKDEIEGVGVGVGKGAASVVKGLLGGKKKN